VVVPFDDDLRFSLWAFLITKSQFARPVFSGIMRGSIDHSHD
jgi:hypothetical protein